MNKPPYVPGTWIADDGDGNNDWCVAADSNGGVIADLCDCDFPEQRKAHAALLAAAPDMAEALGKALQLLIALGLANAPTAPQMLAEYPQVIAARAALAKAGL